MFPGKTVVLAQHAHVHQGFYAQTVAIKVPIAVAKGHGVAGINPKAQALH